MTVRRDLGMASGMGPRHVLTVLAVADLPRSQRFYRAAFPWRAKVEAPNYVELELPEGMRLGLYAAEGFGRSAGQVPHPRPEGSLSGAELYLYSDALEADAARLEAAGARALSPLAPRPWGDDAAYFSDPDGHVIVLARPSLM